MPHNNWRDVTDKEIAKMRVEYGTGKDIVKIIKYQDLSFWGKIKYWITYLLD